MDLYKQQLDKLKEECRQYQDKLRSNTISKQESDNKY